MITTMEVGNVRVFEGFGDWKFPLSRVTVFCGTNGAGKSTILKCLLLLMQTQSAPETDPSPGRLRLAGPLVDLGTYESFVSHNDTSRDIVLGITTRDSVESRHLNRLRKARQLSPTAGPEEKYTEYTLDTTFRFGTLHTESETSQLALNSEFVIEHLNPCTPQAFLKEVTFKFRSESDLTLDWHISLVNQVFNKGVGNSYEMFIPVDYFGSSLGFSMMEVPKDQTGTNAKVHAILRGCLPVGLWAKARRVRRAAEDQEWSYFPLPPLVRDVIADLSRELTEIHYLGPLRSPAKRFYIANLDSTPRMDAAGDFLPYVLRDQGENSVIYRRPKGDSSLTRKPLKSALNEWLHYLRTGEESESGDENFNEIDFTTTKDVLLEFTLQSFGGESHALADSGFGYSQILPIVVKGLVARPGSTLAIEQPELHLNPGLQVRIAEFLASLAACNKTVLIETHSEHIVNSLRVMAAEDRTGALANNCRIFFLDTDLGLPTVRSLEVQPDGTVPSWPRGFMGEALSLSSRLLRAQDYKHQKVNTGD